MFQVLLLPLAQVGTDDDMNVIDDLWGVAVIEIA